MSTATQTIAITGRSATPQRRSVERVYAITSLETLDRYRDLITPALAVSVHHDKDRKAYVFTVARQVQTPYGYRTVVHVGQGLDPLIRGLWFRESTARYSAKDLQQRFDEYLRDHIEPNLPALLDYAAGALGENLD